VTAKSQHRIFRALRKCRPEACLFVAVAVVTAAGFLAVMQDRITDLGFSLVHRPVSGEIVIVQIDSKSLSAIDTWPWPRSRHAEVIDRLIAAGADLVALDMDFSSPSSATEDARLAKSIAAAKGRVVLPSFVQHIAPGVSDELAETNPLPALRDGALIGNANVFAPTGVARNGSIGLYLPDGDYRPTFAGLAGQHGELSIGEFTIDFGIDPAAFPRLSYVDVLRGSFDPALIKGKRVIVGATAIELGDRVPTAIYGVIPGVALQALMAESILQGRTLKTIGPVAALLLAALVLLILRPGQARWSWMGVGLPAGAGVVALLAAPIAVLTVAPLVVETAPALAALAASVLFVGFREFGARASTALRERSAANMRRAMITSIVEESSDGVVVVDVAGRIELINERAARLLNATRSTLLGRQSSAFLPRFDFLKRSLEADDTQRQGELTVDCGGDLITLDVGVRRLTLPADGGEPTRFDVYTLRDVTAKRRAEHAERRAQEEQLMAERAKTNFIANMSHELRTPLNAIIGFSEMMGHQTLGPLGTPKYAEFCDIVAKSGHHLLALINNVLEISRIDQNEAEVNIEDLTFAETVEPCIAFVRGLRDYKSQTITVSADNVAMVRADARLMKHILINLISNAVKFSPEGGSVAISARSVGDAFVFEVTDDGVGIEPTLVPHLTELFYQAQAKFTRRHDGMGVGLYLVKRYTELLKGSIEIESELGKGTRVRVTLPGAAVRGAAVAA
jgi:PAS domain S-box-containing protein